MVGGRLPIEKRGQGIGKEENPARLVRKGCRWWLPTEVDTIIKILLKYEEYSI